MSDPTCEVFKVIDNQGGTRFWSKAGDDKTLTHTIMDSFNTGKISLPTDYEDRFYAAYVKDQRAGVKHYINEIRTPVFALFFDLDMLHTHATMDDADLDKLMQAINYTVKRFFPGRGHENTLFTALFLGAPAKEMDATAIKLGGHVIFPKINVTTVEARFIRVSLVNHLITLFGDQYAAKGWDDAVDEVVYMRQSGGLRLIFSNKAEKCKVCKNAESKKRNCDSCSRTGHICLGRPYTLRRVYTDGVYDDALQSTLMGNMDKLVRYASIRRRESAVVTSGWKRYDGCPSYGVDEVVTDSKKRKQRFGEDETAMRKWKARPSVDRARLSVIQRTIRNAFRDFRKYDNIVVRSAVHGDDKLLWVHVDGDGSTACPNLLTTHNNGEHKSNHIWFSIDPRQVTLRCFCRCKTVEGRRGKPCSKFSVSKQLMQPEREAIFGDLLLLEKSGGGGDKSDYINKSASSFLKTLQAELYGD